MPNSSDGRADIIIYSRSPKGEDKGDLLGIIEVGKVTSCSNLDKVFWQKVGQLNKYLSSLSTNANVKINRAQETKDTPPGNETPTRPDAVKKKQIQTTSLPPKAATKPAPKMMEIEIERFSNDSCPVLLAAVLVTNEHCDKGRFAVFICEKKKPTSWRMALLWRKELSSRVELSSVFGCYISAIKFLATAAVDPDSEQAKQLKVPEERWDYLGPNCSKVTFRDKNNEMRSVVLRLYDNRARQTSRSPQVYLNKEVYGRDCYRVLDIRDQTTIGGMIRPFRDSTYYQKDVFFSTERNQGRREGASHCG